MIPARAAGAATAAVRTPALPGAASGGCADDEVSARTPHGGGVPGQRDAVHGAVVGAAQLGAVDVLADVSAIAAGGAAAAATAATAASASV